MTATTAHRNCDECRRLDMAMQRAMQLGWRTDEERAIVARANMEAQVAYSLHRSR